MKGGSILFSEMCPEIDWEDRFNKWFDTHQVPVRMALPGFLGAQRYKAVERDNYLTVFELENLAALESDAYTNLRDHPNTETRWMLANVTGQSRYMGGLISEMGRKKTDGDPIDAPFVYAEFYSVPDERAKEFNDWYDDEHVPLLLKCDDWLMCRRFEIEDGEPQPWTHLALHYIADLAALDSPEIEAARGTERRQRLAEEPWFQGSAVAFERWGDRFLPEA